MGVKLGTDLARPASALTPWAALLVLAASRPMFAASYHVVDGGSGKVRSFVDQSDNAHLLDQANSANQVAVPATHADYAGKLCATFTGAEYYQSNAIAKAVPQHSGAGSSSFLLVTRTNTGGFHVIAASTTFSTLNERGFGVAGLNGGQTQVYVGNGASNQFNAGAAGAFTVNVPTWRDWSYGEGQAPDEWIVRNKTVTSQNGTTANTPSGSNPVGAMVLGANTAGSFGFVGRWHSWLSFPWLDASGRSQVQAWILAETGLS